MSFTDISGKADTVLQVIHGRTTVEWEIKKFFNLPCDVCSYLDSSTFLFFDAEWYIRIFPSRNFQDDPLTWISLFLFKRQSSSKFNISYTFGLKRANGSMLKSFECTRSCSQKEEGFGISKCFLRVKLADSEDLLEPNGTVTVVCSIHLLNEATVRKDAASQAASTDACFMLTSEIDGWKSTIRELKNKLSILQKEKEVAVKELEKVSLIKNEKEKKIKDLKNDEESLSEHFKKLLVSECQTDVTMCVKDKEFRAHKCVLAARSLVFRAMFDADMSEKYRDRVDIDDCEPNIFQDFLLFLYSAKQDVVSASNAVGLYSVADKYDVKKLKTICVEVMTLELSIDIVFDVIRLATLYDEHELLEISTEFFINNSDVIVATSRWISFLAEDLILANELLVKMTKKFKKHMALEI